MKLPILCLLALLSAVGLNADTSQDIGEWDRVTVPTMKTSIYVGSVTLVTKEFRRTGEQYTSAYEARVRPWSFWSETGKITLTLSSADLEKLARGERVEFTGQATSHKNKPRTVSGRADPTNAATGKLKVRIRAEGVELVFNGTYRFSNVRK